MKSLYSVTNFFPIVWHFCSTEDTREMEKIQYRLLKWVYSDFNTAYGELREMSQMKLLYTQKIPESFLIAIYRIYNNIFSVFALFTEK